VDNLIQHPDQNFVDITIQASGNWTKKKDYSNMSKPQMIPSEIIFQCAMMPPSKCHEQITTCTLKQLTLEFF
jgi:hypothetical protein